MPKESPNRTALAIYVSDYEREIIDEVGQMLNLSPRRTLIRVLLHWRAQDTVKPADLDDLLLTTEEWQELRDWCRREEETLEELILTAARASLKRYQERNRPFGRGKQLD